MFSNYYIPVKKLTLPPQHKNKGLKEYNTKNLKNENFKIF